MQEMPPRVAVSEVPDNAQVPDVTAQVKEPDDWPPVAVSDNADPVTKVAAFDTARPDWGALFTVTEVLDELTAL